MSESLNFFLSENFKVVISFGVWIYRIESFTLYRLPKYFLRKYAKKRNRTTTKNTEQ